MSQKITSKNLSYSSSLPPFLAALHAEAAGASSGPDRLAAGQRRSAKKRSSSEEAEDAPLVVDEQGNAVSVQVDGDGALVPDAEAAAGRGEAPKPDDAVAEVKPVLGGRKRKVGRVVAGDDDGPGDASRKNEMDAANKPGEKVGQPIGKRTGKKAKKIKLSFDQDEGEG